MTRYLSSILGATEPVFGQSIQQLEQASGRPSADIRLSAEVMQKAKQKIASLGLDPEDTTGPELYGALHERLREDEAKVREALNISETSSAAEVTAAVQQFLSKHEAPKNCFALKASAAKRLFKKKAPKNAMKRLGYRSLDSMLKHEHMACIYAAVLISESATWQRTFREQYAKLQPTDFEQRDITIVMPKSKRWSALATQYTESSRQNILCFKELGAVVLLPLETHVDGLALATLLLSLTFMNDIRAHSSYTKLQQVRPDFGKIIQKVSVSEPFTSAELAGQPVSWNMIQRFYGKFQHAYHPEIFEPHVQPEDLQWQSAEDVIIKLQPTLEFWQDSQYVGIVHDGQPVSFNILDVVLSYCNKLSFADRIVHFLRDNLWHELMMRYLNQQNLEEAVHRQLSRELVDDTALAES
jgi:hypothetical protein